MLPSRPNEDIVPNDIVIFLPRSIDDTIRFEELSCDIIPVPTRGLVKMFVPETSIPVPVSTRVHFISNAIFESIVRNIRVIDGHVETKATQTSRDIQTTAADESATDEPVTDDPAQSTIEASESDQPGTSSKPSSNPPRK